MSENEMYRRPLAAYRRTWPQRLADAAPYFGVLVLVVANEEWLSSWWLIIPAGVVGIFLVALGVERSAHYRGQRDRYRRSLVALVTKVEIDQTRDYFAHLVPADVLAEAFPTPSPSPAPEGHSNHREAGDV